MLYLGTLTLWLCLRISLGLVVGGWGFTILGYNSILSFLLYFVVNSTNLCHSIEEVTAT